MTLTSGSTGLPKAVVHNVSAHLANAEGVCALMNFGKDQSWLLSLPLYHVSGQGIVWRWLYAGATLVYRKRIFINLLVRFSCFSCANAITAFIRLFTEKSEHFICYTPYFTGRSAYSDRTYSEKWWNMVLKLILVMEWRNGVYGFAKQSDENKA